MPSLFDPIHIGSMEIKNRFVRSSTHEAMADEKGCPEPGLGKVYERLAKGEVGLIITGMAFVSREGRSTAKRMLGIHHDGLIPKYRELVSHAHDHGAKIAMQITHAGRQTREEATGVKPMAPSAVYDSALLSKPREMTEEDIKGAIDSYAQACGRVRESGFDAVQIQLGHGYLPNQFQSPFLNRRRDRWGGSLENRMRFIKVLYGRCRQVVGEDYPILAKVNIEDNMRKGLKPEEGVPMARMMGEMGFDCLEVSSGVYADGFSMMRGELPMDVFLEWDLYKNNMNRLVRFLMRRFGNRMFGVLPFTELFNWKNAKAVKEAVNTPIMLVGGLRKPCDMERIVQQGDADLISLCRPLIAEPFLPKRIREKRTHPSKCISCNLCLAYLEWKPLRCYMGKQLDGKVFKAA
jgi:2,4-dienoyl-CoA reductase-like NADH-dependent reductase (Old Yellow Enzyme family)